MTDFGDELHRLLAERHVSLREAARRAGCSAGYLSNVASGRKPLTPSLAASLDRAFETGGMLTAYALRPEREHPQGPDRGQQRPGARRAAGRPVPARAGLACDALRERWPGIRLSRVLSGYGDDGIMELPPGRLLDGVGQMALRVQRAADGYTSHLLDARVQFLVEMILVEVTAPAMTRPADPALNDVPRLSFGGR